NIAEGFRKSSKVDKKRFMNTARGSLEECRYYLILSKDLGYGETAGSLLPIHSDSWLLTPDSFARIGLSGSPG
ncbi:MAG: four helix bundle protein, partial [bacterium]